MTAAIGRMSGRIGGPADGRDAAGFTLIELLVTLTLVGLISLVLFGGLRFGTRAWDLRLAIRASTAPRYRDI